MQFFKITLQLDSLERSVGLMMVSHSLVLPLLFKVLEASESFLHKRKGLSSNCHFLGPFSIVGQFQQLTEILLTQTFLQPHIALPYLAIIVISKLNTYTVYQDTCTFVLTLVVLAV